MKASFCRLCVIFSAVVILAGCATPQPALDQANNGAALIGSLRAELQNFRRVQASIAQSRLESVRRQRARLAIYESGGGFDDRLLRAAGRDDLVRLYTSLRDLSESRAQDELRLKATISEIDQLLGELVKPLPEQTKSLTQAQESLAALGEELSLRRRLEEAAKFAKEIQGSIEQNKLKIEEGSPASPPSIQPLP